MLSIADAFDKFRSRLEISPSERDDASRRQQTIRKQVQAGIGVAHDFLTGSYARHTKTRPLKDVDIFVQLDEEERGYLDRPPVEVLTTVRGILVPHHDEQRVSVARRSVRVDFGVTVVGDVSDQVVSFDVVPAFADNGSYLIPDKDLGTWVRTDPRVHATLATDANAKLDEHWKPAVKMVKKWNNHHDRPIKPSFLLEVMALDLLAPPWSGSYPYEIKQFFATAADRIGDGWRDPADLGPPVSDRLDGDPTAMAAAKRALRRAEASCTEALRQENAGRVGAALDVWQGLFGPLFAKS